MSREEVTGEKRMQKAEPKEKEGISEKTEPKTKRKLEQKRQKEQRVVGEMIALYCRKHHADDQKGQLCPVCQELADYARARSAHCPFMEQKTFCANCAVHCYKPAMREEIRKVMRYSGPRMLLYHPGLAIWHLVCSIKEKKGRKNG